MMIGVCAAGSSLPRVPHALGLGDAVEHLMEELRGRSRRGRRRRRRRRRGGGEVGRRTRSSRRRWLVLLLFFSRKLWFLSRWSCRRRCRSGGRVERRGGRRGGDPAEERGGGGREGCAGAAEGFEEGVARDEGEVGRGGAFHANVSVVELSGAAKVRATVLVRDVHASTEGHLPVDEQQLPMIAMHEPMCAVPRWVEYWVELDYVRTPLLQLLNGFAGANRPPSQRRSHAVVHQGHAHSSLERGIEALNGPPTGRIEPQDVRLQVD
mmetsp:Transcript_23242/g.45324  ORF Transcript_23242/g.45324 Transcript_23242/m.45324 type:complete len:266 (-) Transcript_23242:406-1203(-)